MSLFFLLFCLEITLLDRYKLLKNNTFISVHLNLLLSCTYKMNKQNCYSVARDVVLVLGYMTFSFCANPLVFKLAISDTNVLPVLL